MSMDFGKKRLAYGLKKGKNVVLDDFSVDFSRFVKSSITFRKSDV